MSVDPARIDRLVAASSAARWGVPPDSVRRAIETSVRRAFEGRVASAADVARHLEALHVDDLVLAVACASGVEAAWDHFIREYRPLLYRAAEAIDHTGGARELADSLYAELYGLREREGERQSLFRYFHGRSSLATWLRAILAQRHVDRIRATRKLDALPDDDAPGAMRSTDTERSAPDPRLDARVDAVRQALNEAVSELDARDRLRLGLYYVQNVKLAAIGRLLGEHEASASRHLSRARSAIRERVDEILRDRHRLTADAIADAIQALVGDAGSLDIAELIGALPDSKILPARRSTE